jgi:hypothetical protein
MERTGVVCEAYDLLEAHDELERLGDRGEQIGRPIPGARPCWRRFSRRMLSFELVFVGGRLSKVQTSQCQPQNQSPKFWGQKNKGALG